MANHTNHKRGQTRPRDETLLLPLYYKKVDDIDAIAVGNRLAAVRIALRMSMREFGENLQLSPDGISKMERGDIAPGGRTLILLHEFYGVDIQWLLFGCHTTHMDLLNVLSNMDDAIKFDIFTRLYSYFSNPKWNDKICFIPNHRTAKNVTHFAKWEHTLYRPISDGEKMDDEVEFVNDVENATFTREELDELAQRLPISERERFFEQLNKILKQPK